MTKPQVIIENFTIEAPDWLACRCGCRLFNYDTRFLISLQAFRYSYGKPLTPTSGCRCQKHNNKPAKEGGVGSTNSSGHQATTKKATAIDVRGANLREIYDKAVAFGRATGLFNEIYLDSRQGFVHIAFIQGKKFACWTQ